MKMMKRRVPYVFVVTVDGRQVYRGSNYVTAKSHYNMARWRGRVVVVTKRRK